MTQWTADDYLMHHGIKGQKWGIRRFQNEDGTWTAEGKRHRGFGSSDGLSRAERKQMKKRGKQLLKEAKKQAKQLSKQPRVSENDKKFVEPVKNLDEASRKGGAAYDEASRKASDTSSIKDKSQKASEEQRIMEGWDSGSSDSVSSRYYKHAATGLHSRIADVADYYNGDMKTKELKSLYKAERDAKSEADDLDRAARKVKSERDALPFYKKEKARELDAQYHKAKADYLLAVAKQNRIADDYDGAVLRSIGYEDTPESRKKVHHIARFD